jgi:hypothetical protein
VEEREVEACDDGGGVDVGVVESAGLGSTSIGVSSSGN